jgi:predicted nucleic acid-binding protein
MTNEDIEDIVKRVEKRLKKESVDQDDFIEKMKVFLEEVEIGLQAAKEERP